MHKFLIINCLNILFWSCQDKPFVYQGNKIKGISYVAPSQKIDTWALKPVQDVNAEWLALMPYCFIKTDEAKVFYGDGHQWWGETPTGIVACIKLAHQNGLKVMLKPHTWIGRSGYTGDLEFSDEAHWQKFEEEYQKYVLDFARIADSTHTEIYCIGTEFKKFVEKRPVFWSKLIQEVRKVYAGKLTYAENWDCFDKVPFWQELDFVGIDGYFPLTDERNPPLETIQKGWQTHLDKIQKCADKCQKSILFTEFGYQNTDFSTQKPWETMNEFPENDELQANAYRAVFSEVWNKKYFAGGFLWKWFPKSDNFEQHHDKYSPQNKPAESVLRDFYQKINTPKNSRQ